MLIDGNILLLDLQEVKGHTAQLQDVRIVVAVSIKQNAYINMMRRRMQTRTKL
jgi:hypothetical protein